MLDRIGGGLKEYSPFMLRLGLATIFIASGARNLTNLSSSPDTSDVVVAGVGILGGLFCLMGFMTRWAAFALGGLMIWVILDGPRAHALTRWNEQISFACLVMCAALYGLGGGKWSVDEGKKKKD